MEILSLNIFQRFIRFLAKAYPSTHLRYVGQALQTEILLTHVDPIILQRQKTLVDRIGKIWDKTYPETLYSSLISKKNFVSDKPPNEATEDKPSQMGEPIMKVFQANFFTWPLLK